MPRQHDDRRLEAALAQNAHRLATIDIGKPDIHNHEVDLSGPGGLHTPRTGLDLDRFKLFVERQLPRPRAAPRHLPRSKSLLKFRDTPGLTVSIFRLEAKPQLGRVLTDAECRGFRGEAEILCSL
jgi:hypothetical protein